jgi:hypothetical protein
MLEKNPEDRPASASAALDAIERALANVGQVVPSGLPRLEAPPLQSMTDAISGPRSPQEVAQAQSLAERATEYHPMFPGSQPPAAQRKRPWLWLALLAVVLVSLFALTRLETPEASEQARPSQAEPAKVSAELSAEPKADLLGEPTSAAHRAVTATSSVPGTGSLVSTTPGGATSAGGALNGTTLNGAAPSGAAASSSTSGPAPSSPKTSTHAKDAERAPRPGPGSQPPAPKPTPESPLTPDPIPKDLENPFGP